MSVRPHRHPAGESTYFDTNPWMMRVTEHPRIRCTVTNDCKGFVAQYFQLRKAEPERMISTGNRAQGQPSGRPGDMGVRDWSRPPPAQPEHGRENTSRRPEAVIAEFIHETGTADEESLDKRLHEQGLESKTKTRY
jgi:hypothetical protein